MFLFFLLVHRKLIHLFDWQTSLMSQISPWFNEWYFVHCPTLQTNPYWHWSLFIHEPPSETKRCWAVVTWIKKHRNAVTYNRIDETIFKWFIVSLLHSLNEYKTHQLMLHHSVSQYRLTLWIENSLNLCWVKDRIKSKMPLHCSWVQFSSVQFEKVWILFLYLSYFISLLQSQFVPDKRNN